MSAEGTAAPLEVSAVIRHIGKITVGASGVRIRNVLTSTELKYERITSVTGHALSGKIEIETGAQVHTVRLWNPLSVNSICDAIRERMDAMTAYGPSRYTPPANARARVDDGGPGEFGTYRKRDGSAYEDAR